MNIVAILKHIASKNADYGKSLEYLMFEHTENGVPVRNAAGDMIMREGFILDGINCSPYSYDKECEMLNSQFHKNQKYSDIKSHHYIISFDPQDNEQGKLTPEMAHALGMEFARKHFPGHQILVCTHTDGHNESGNIHVHIIFNSVRKLDVEKEAYMERDIDCRAGFKHHLTKGYLEYLQAEVMDMCVQRGLHQVDLLSPAKSKITDKEYRAQQRGQQKLDELNKQIVAARMKPRTTVFQTQKQYLRDAISDIASQAVSLDEFKTMLKEKYGIDVNDKRGRFSYLHPDRKKYITGRALGSDYEKEYLEQIIHDMVQSKEYPAMSGHNDADYQKSAKSHRSDKDNSAYSSESKNEYDPSYDYHADPVAILYIRSHLRLVTDLQSSIKAQQSAAYARKVKISNLKEMARTVVYIQEHGYDTEDDLQKHSHQISDKKAAVQEALAQTKTKITDLNELIHFSGRYYATRQIQSDFLKARFKKKYREEHHTELDQYQEAISFFQKHYDGKVPSMKQLKAKKEKLLILKSEQHKELSGFNQMERELQTAAANVNSILHGNIMTVQKNHSLQVLR